ncbi:MAG TPA: PDZ domain-containing protein [Blastocatellia bacterium]|nr:PDZ domain-containing protein [Blastocatellia bacterium]
MSRLFALLVFLIVSCSISEAQPRIPRPFASASVSRSEIAFSFAGDLWIVDRSGGEARRLMSSPSAKYNPIFSPDGSEIAFGMEINRNWDVYVVPTSGGEPRRLTHHPGVDFACGWTPDGKAVLVESFRAAQRFPGESRLLTIPAGGGMPTELPFPQAGIGSLAPDGARIAYTSLPLAPQDQFHRNYRGGATSSILIGNLSDSRVEELPRSGSNDGLPMWLGDNIYFVSDRAGVYNLFAYDTRSKKVTQLTRFEKYDIKYASMSASGDAIVFIQDGAIHLYDLKTASHRPVEIRLSGDFPEIKPRQVDVASWIRSSDVSPDQKYVLLGVRGEILKVDLQTGAFENLTHSPGVAEHTPRWSPDGKRIAYLSDESGEYQLHVRPAAGEGPVRKIAIEQKPSIYTELQWAPDSTKVALSNRGLALLYVDIDKEKSHRVDIATHDYTVGASLFEPSWSPDSRWLAYARRLPNRLRGVFVHSLESGRTALITDSRSDSRRPSFDKNGKYLYFRASANAGPDKYGMSGNPFRSSVTSSTFIVLLDKDSDLTRRTSDEAAAPTRIDFQNIGERILPLPADWPIASTNDRPRFERDKAPLKDVKIEIDPRAEWRLIYNEAWRLLREYFYDPGHHGLEISALKEKYASYLPNLVTRDDLNSVIKEAFSHISISHLRIEGGDQPPANAQSERVGLLGADYKIDQGKFRFANIYRGDNSTQKQLRSPLGQPGLNVKEGDYLLEVDGQKLKEGDNLYRYFIGKADKPCQLRISSTVDWEQSRVVTVTPVADEYPLRHYDWVMANHRKVDQLSGGKLAYIYLPNTAENGYEIFNREFYAQLDKQGVIIDERFNSGGVAADYIIDILRRSPLYKVILRESEDVSMPMGVIEGPRVMIINEVAGSGGDSLPFMFRAARLGTIVGKRTLGAAVGGANNSLLDGGRMTIPDWGHYDHTKGVWTAENLGVPPDIEVDILPSDWRAGRDPQLERAVQIALEEMQKNPPRNKRPKFPVYK